ncbi:MAG: hypothetical protein U0T83_02230 [Bacteriovoracaceae bacterium]
MLKVKYFAIFFLSLFFVRIAIFSINYGAIDHDGGWFSGVARNMAENFQYASYTNPLTGRETIGKGIWGRPAIQDEKGNVYFTSGVSAGPAFVFPEALFLKIFGFSIISFKIFPLISFLILILLCAYFTYVLSGYFGLILLTAWWWLIPQEHLPMAYDGLAEHIALMYFFLSLYFFYKREKHKKFVILSGVFLSFSVLTKLLFFMFLGAFILYYIEKFLTHKKAIIKEFLMFVLAFAIPLLLFEAYRFCVFMFKFNFQAWVNNNLEHTTHFSTGGGTLSKLLSFDLSHMQKKLSFIYGLGINSTYLIWAIIAVSLLFFWKKFRDNSSIQILIYSTFGMSLWFIFISSSGFSRHFYPAIFFIQILLVSLLVNFVKSKLDKKIKIILCCLIPFSFNFQMFTHDFNLDLKNISNWDKYRYMTGLQGFPTNPVFPLAEQEGVVGFIEENKANDYTYYYLSGYIVAEISGITGKVFYPLQRVNLNRFYNVGKKHLLILGPYNVAQTPWSLSGPELLVQVKNQLCNKELFRNNSYFICEIK